MPIKFREVHRGDYQFALQPKWYGYILVYREAVPMNSAGDWMLGKWRKASWKEMIKFSKERSYV